MTEVDLEVSSFPSSRKRVLSYGFVFVTKGRGSIGLSECVPEPCLRNPSRGDIHTLIVQGQQRWCGGWRGLRCWRGLSGHGTEHSSKQVFHVLPSKLYERKW